MATNIDICNRALTRIGAEKITSFDDGSREAEVVSELYEHNYDTLLTEAKWNFAIHDIELSLDVTEPTDKKWNYMFLLPSDYMSVVQFYAPSGAQIVNYTVQNGYVYTNFQRVFIKYVSKPTEQELPPYFLNYMVVKLAHDCAEPLIGIGSVQDRLAQEYVAARAVAYKMDHNENPEHNAFATSTYVSVRY